jgi:hypothetical protein
MNYLEIEDKNAVSPILFSARMMDKSEELNKLLQLIYDIYDAENIPHTKEIL